jgi:hypothetical protein
MFALHIPFKIFHQAIKLPSFKPHRRRLSTLPDFLQCPVMVHRNYMLHIVQFIELSFFHAWHQEQA